MTDHTQAERRAIISAEARAARAERFHKNTYYSHAQADADLAAGGRYAKVEERPVVGVPIYPALPASSPWHCDPIGIEPPLGIDVNAMEPTGTEIEIAKSLACASHSPTMRAPPDRQPSGVGARSLRRRI